MSRRTTAAQLRREVRAVACRTRKRLEAAAVPGDRTEQQRLARAARADPRLFPLHAWSRPWSQYRSQTWPGVYLEQSQDGSWCWASADWSATGTLLEPVGSYPTMRAALAAWAVALDLEAKS